MKIAERRDIERKWEEGGHSGSKGREAAINMFTSEDREEPEECGREAGPTVGQRG